MSVQDDQATGKEDSKRRLDGLIFLSTVSFFLMHSSRFPHLFPINCDQVDIAGPSWAVNDEPV